MPSVTADCASDSARSRPVQLLGVADRAADRLGQPLGVPLGAALGGVHLAPSAEVGGEDAGGRAGQEVLVDDRLGHQPAAVDAARPGPSGGAARRGRPVAGRGR